MLVGGYIFRRGPQRLLALHYLPRPGRSGKGRRYWQGLLHCGRFLLCPYLTEGSPGQVRTPDLTCRPCTASCGLVSFFIFLSLFPSFVCHSFNTFSPPPTSMPFLSKSLSPFGLGLPFSFLFGHAVRRARCFKTKHAIIL